jgi:hypothetical protein
VDDDRARREDAERVAVPAIKLFADNQPCEFLKVAACGPAAPTALMNACIVWQEKKAFLRPASPARHFSDAQSAPDRSPVAEK